MIAAAAIAVAVVLDIVDLFGPIGGPASQPLQDLAHPLLCVSETGVSLIGMESVSFCFWALSFEMIKFQPLVAFCNLHLIWHLIQASKHMANLLVRGKKCTRQ